VEVGDGHDAIDARPYIRDIVGGGEAEEKDDGQKQEKKTVPGAALSVAGHLNPLRSISVITDFVVEINRIDPFAAKRGSGLTPDKPKVPGVDSPPPVLLS
jgi:hypothetical protein